LNSVCPIKWLYADRNRIHEVRIDAGNGLLTVSLDENWLTRFPLLALDDDNNGDQPQQSGNRVYPNLQSLSLAGNLLEEVPEELVARFPALQQLDLARNRLTELVLDVSKRDEKDGHQQLRVLNASGNLLGALELAGEGRLDALTVLDLSANRLTRFSLWTLGGWLPAIEHLHLDGNPELAAGGAGGGFDLLPSGGFGSNPLQLPPLVEVCTLILDCALILYILSNLKIYSLIFLEFILYIL
jgi:Leucine-rich repeat (LRR) protein